MRIDQTARHLLIVLACIFGAALPAVPCSCQSGHTPCGEVTAGSAVFIGRVLSVSPAFLNRFNQANRASGNRLNQFYNELAAGGPVQSVDELKKTFRSLVTGLPPDVSERLNDGKSKEELRKVLDVALYHGSYVTLQVRSVFTAGHGDHDDTGDNDDDDSLARGKPFSLWTPTFDCGVEFQVGEMYLVYASRDEDTNDTQTDICMGTRRLTDAGADLPYLSFVKDDPEQAGHIDGFVTSDAATHANPPEKDEVPAPQKGILMELKSNDGFHYATSDAAGRFTFDGLAKGAYEVRGYSSEAPDPASLVAGPEEIRIDPKACKRYFALTRQRP